MGALRNGNFIGQNIIKFRHRKNWTQEILVARMQLLGCCMTCDIIANIENRPATHEEIMYFAEVFGVRAGELFHSYFSGNRQYRRDAGARQFIGTY